jgi:N6-adenosine-specific RNA methylase IME4
MTNNIMTKATLSPVLWQSGDHKITLVDIPRSISLAQGTYGRPCHDLLFSSQPQTEPYKTNEPNSAAARSKLLSNTVDAAAHELYAELLNDALDRVKTVHDGRWCLPRPFLETSTKGNLKRKLDAKDANDFDNPKDLMTATCQTVHREDEMPDGFLRKVSRQAFSVVHGIECSGDSHPYQYHPSSELNTRASFSVGEPGSCDAPYTFYIPPNSSFVLGPCSDVHTLHTYVRAQAQELDVPKKFDLILLDPPWPNRSVKRTHKTAHSTYSTAQSLEEIYQLLMGMDLDVLMADSCLVAVWITNKPAVRDLVLGENGLFDCLGVELVEEWVWLKTTVHGEPITPIDSVWRKPYEVLLIGRKSRQYSLQSKDTPKPHIQIPRKVVISVPDLHSRKPCLKELFERYVPHPNSYRALEIFARYLVAGWWSWGNECIKFNGKQYWQAESERSQQEEQTTQV